LAASDVGRAIESWLELYRKGEVPQSTGLQPLSWRQSAEQLMEIVTQDAGAGVSQRQEYQLQDVADAALRPEL
jgi:hypothetical protein